MQMELKDSLHLFVHLNSYLDVEVRGFLDLLFLLDSSLFACFSQSIPE